ncbi:unnamed protein product [Gadus morhua 'NCC']
MEITLQFGAKEQDPESAVPLLSAGERVSVQLQLRYRLRDGREMLRVLTAQREVTHDSSSVLSSLSLAIIQLNSSPGWRCSGGQGPVPGRPGRGRRPEAADGQSAAA